MFWIEDLCTWMSTVGYSESELFYPQKCGMLSDFNHLVRERLSPPIAKSRDPAYGVLTSLLATFHKHGRAFMPWAITPG